MHPFIAVNSTHSSLIMGEDLVCMHPNDAGRYSLLYNGPSFSHHAVSEGLDELKAFYSAVGIIPLLCIL